MKYEQRADEEKQNILEVVKNVIAQYVDNSEEISNEIINNFCTITPPETEDIIQILMMRPSGVGGGSSIKPGNIWLDWKKLLIDGSESILTIAGVIAMPWLIPLAGLVIWNKVWSLLTIKIDERHAVVIWSMWKNKDNENHIENNKILSAVNSELTKYNRSLMNALELDGTLKDLEKMACIKKTDNEKWWLREWVKTVYI